jgi:uncharacterized membrane protein HdeD (DUF308 family)
MFNEAIESVKDTIKHWYLPLILGILFIIVGILAIITPQATYLSLALIFSMTFLFVGILEIVFSISHRKQLDGWGWSLASGIFSTITGVLLIIYPQVSIITLPLFVGFVVLFHSIMSIAWSIELKKYKVSNWGWLLFAGILGAIFSFLLMLNPVIAGLTIAIWTGIALITIGIFHIHFSIELKKLKKTFKSLNDSKEK